MKHIRLISALLLLSVLGSFVHADTVTATWANPTTNVNGSAIAASGVGSLTQARIEYGTCNGAAFGTKAGEVIRAFTAGPLTTATLNLQPGTTCIQVKVSNTYGNESGASNVVTKVIATPVPNPPTNLTVTDPVAFDVKPNEQTFAFDRGRSVGTAKIGAACDETRTTGGGFFALERPSRVKLTKQPRSVALVAKCGAA